MAYSGAGAGTLASPYIITTVLQLQEMNDFLSMDVYFALGNDIDASSTSTWNSGAGFIPIGTGAYFGGSFNGNGYSISGLTINRPSEDRIGLFGFQTAAGARTITDFTLQDVSITGRDYVGAVSAYTLSAAYSKIQVSGNVSGRHYVGGLFGWVVATVTQCSSTASVLGSGSSTGGVAGYTDANTAFSNCYSSGNVTGSGTYTGGFIGAIRYCALMNCYACGKVLPASGSVGGMAGASYHAYGITNCFWDTETSEQATSVVGVGKTTLQMYSQSTFVGWDFVNYWQITDGISYPTLRAVPLTGIIDLVSPSFGPIGGGTDVILTGLGFTGATGVTFNDVAAINFALISDTEIQCTTPRNPKGSVNVVVIKP